MESKCAVVFFDEIDALGQSRVTSDNEGGGVASQGAGGDNSSRRVLAELLIQMTRLATNGDGYESDSEAEDKEEGYGDEESTMSTGSASFGRDGTCLGCRLMSPMRTSSDFEMKIQAKGDSEAGSPEQPGEGGNQYSADKLQPKPRVIVVAATNRPAGKAFHIAAEHGIFASNFNIYYRS